MTNVELQSFLSLQFHILWLLEWNVCTVYMSLLVLLPLCMVYNLLVSQPSWTPAPPSPPIMTFYDAQNPCLTANHMMTATEYTFTLFSVDRTLLLGPWLFENWIIIIIIIIEVYWHGENVLWMEEEEVETRKEGGRKRNEGEMKEETE
jgi:hypothetical protein